MLFGGILASSVQADPADDALAKLNELSRQAEQTTEAMHTAQLDLNNKLAVQEAAEAQHAADLGARGFGQVAVGNIPDNRRQGCCRAIYGWPARRPRRDADRLGRRRG